MSNKLSGQCACGGIRYSTIADPEFTLIGHCRQCQRITGSGHAASFAVPTNETTIEGELTFFDQTADSGNIVSSGFCSVCFVAIGGKVLTDSQNPITP